MAEEIINPWTETEERTNLKDDDQLLLGNSDTGETQRVKVGNIKAATAPTPSDETFIIV